jgi:hypothetical protein
MSVQITLEGKAWFLPKDFIQEKLAGSLFAEALTLDPEAKVIPLDNPAVKPIVLDFLVNLAKGEEPSQHIPEIIEADRYLNLTWILVYADPLYDETTSIGSMSVVLEEAIRLNKPWVVHYLGTHKEHKSAGLDNFRIAVIANAVDVVKYYLQNGIGVAIYDDALNHAAEKGEIQMAKLLLSHAEVNPSADANKALKLALKYYSFGVADLILMHPKFEPGIGQDHIFDWAIHADLHDVVTYLLAHPAIDPAHDNNTAICVAFDEGNLRMVQLVLADSRINPAMDDNMLLREALDGYSYERVELLVTDPRVKLTPELKAKLRAFVFVRMNAPTECDPLLDYT